VGRLGLVNRRLWARYVAPAVFLLAVTGVVLLIRSALRGDGKAATTATHATQAQQRTASSPSVGRLRIPAQYYVIRSGDTLDAIAARFATTVDALLALNPGVEPTTLRPGQRLRIK
jgi:LysM repeat protein